MTERMSLAAVGRQNRQRAALARRAELRPAARRLAAVAVGFAGGWAVLYGALMPFGLGFVLGFAEDCFAPCAAGTALGVLLHGFGALSLRSVCMLCALGAAVAARWMGARTLTPAALAGCGTLVGVALCFAFGGGGAELVFYSAADALLAAAMGFCLRQFAPEKPGAGMLLVGAATAAALGSVQLWQLLPGVIVCAALELYLCSKGQAKAALAACAVLGAALCAADPALSFAASGLACATVAAAVLAPGRRMETVAAYAGGCVTGALCVQPPGSAFQYLLNVCIGITAVAAMPAAWLVPEPEEKPQAGQAQPQQYSAAATRLEQVSQSLASLAETVNDVYETLPHRCEDFHWVIDNTHDTLCFNCGRRDTCWKQEYAATLEGMEALHPLLESSGGLETAQLPGQLSRCIHPAALCAAANRSFALYRSRKEARLHAEAMRTALTEQYSAVAEALGVLGEQLGRPGDPEPYKSGRVADFFAQLGTPPQECAVTLDDLGRTHAAVTLPRTRFSAQELAALAGEVGRICRRTLEVPQVLSCKGMTTLLFSEKPVLRAVFGMAGAAARGSISGDAVQQFCSPAAAQMILCDGMGTGRPAAVLILPPDMEQALPERLLGGGPGGGALLPRPGGGPGEDYDLRDYRPGDPLRSVHWKLSSKRDELVVRETLEPRQTTLVLTYDHFGAPAALDQTFARLCALSRALLERGRPHHIQWASPTGGGVEGRLVDSERALLACLELAFSRPAPAEGRSILDTALRLPGRAGPLRHIHVTPTGLEGGAP